MSVELEDYLEQILWEVRQEHLAEDREWHRHDREADDDTD